MRPEPGTNPEWDARVNNLRKKREDITERFRWRRHHNQRHGQRIGLPNEWHASGRPPVHEKARDLPKETHAIKDWRYYRRRTGFGIWTDLYNTPARNIAKFGLVNKKVLTEDIHGLKVICDNVAKEQDAQQDAKDRLMAQGQAIRSEFAQTIQANRSRCGGKDYAARLRGEAVLEPTLLLPPQVSMRTQRLSLTQKGVDARRRHFERLGCQDMQGLLVGDRGLAEHMHHLAQLVDVELPTNAFIPKKETREGARVRD